METRRFDQCPCKIVVELPIRNDFYTYKGLRYVAIRLQCVDCGFVHIERLPDRYAEDEHVPYRLYVLGKSGYVRLDKKPQPNTGGTKCQAHTKSFMAPTFPAL